MASVTFALHLRLLPEVGSRIGDCTVTLVNPFTNAIVVQPDRDNELTALSHRAAVPIWEKDLHDHARRNCDLWGMLFGYAVIVEQGDPANRT